MKKCFILAYFSKFFKNHAFNFRAFGRKTHGWENFKKILKFLEENPIEKMIFLLFLEKLLLKIKPSKITSDFYNNFFLFRGGYVPVFPPSRRPWHSIILAFLWHSIILECSFAFKACSNYWFKSNLIFLTFLFKQWRPPWKPRYSPYCTILSRNSFERLL